MAPEAEKRMPKCGEGWRHYKGDLYEVVGTGYGEATGTAIVIYKEYMWPFDREPTLWSMSLDVFLGVTDTSRRRFEFEREPG